MSDRALVPSDAAPSTLYLLKRLWRLFLRPHIGRLLLAFFFMALYGASEAAGIKMLQTVIDHVFVAKDASLLWPVAGIVLVIFFLKSLADYGQAASMGWLGLRVVAEARKRLFDHLVGMDAAFFGRHHSGSLTARFTVDVQTLSGAVSGFLTRVGKDALTVVFLVALLFYQDALLASVLLVVLPIAAGPIDKMGRKMRKTSADTQEETGQLNAVLSESFQAVRVVKAYRMEERQTGRVRDLVYRIFDLAYRAARIRAFALPFMELIGGIAVALVILYGGYRVIDGAITAGAFFSFIAAMIAASRPIQALGNLHVTLQEGLAGAARIFEVLDTQSAISDSADAKPLAMKKGAIALEDVSFAHEGRAAALDGISCHIKAGQTVALVGASGAGKTTFLNMLLRFYDPDTGQVMIDGQDIKNVTLASLRKGVALVEQHVTLFDDTIRANLLCAKPDATEDELWAALDQAAATDFVKEALEGLETQVGQKGVKLSGGQRQRLALARAVLKDAPILLLDEATSALDTDSEKKVQKALDQVAQDRTTLIIAHRLSTIRHADRIIVMDQGKIVESGTDAGLRKKNGIYARLCSLQEA